MKNQNVFFPKTSFTFSPKTMKMTNGIDSLVHILQERFEIENSELISTIATFVKFQQKMKKKIHEITF